MLFTHGNSIIDKGVECDFVVVSAQEVDEYLSKGYFKTPEEVAADLNDSGKLSNEEIRQAARDAGIDNWEKARINTLKEALGYA